MSTCAAPSRNPAGVLVHSQQIAYDSGTGGIDIPLNFLDTPLAQQGDNGRISYMALRLSLNVTTEALGGARDELFARTVARLVLSDKHGKRVDLSGSSLRLLDFLEDSNFSFGKTQEIGASTTTTVVGFLRIPVEPCLAARPQDYRWHTREFRQGKAQIDWASSTIGPAAANRITINNGYAELWVETVDEGHEEAKTRLCLLDYGINANEHVFTVRGRLRAAIQYLGEVAESATATPDEWASQTISSPSLQFYSVRDDVLVDRYRAMVRPRRTSPALVVDERDPIMRGCAMPLVYPKCGQPIAEMPEVQSFDWRTTLDYSDGTFTAANRPRMIFAVIEDRPSGSFGGNCNDDGWLAKGADGSMVRLTALPQSLRKKFPVIRAPFPS